MGLSERVSGLTAVVSITTGVWVAGAIYAWQSRGEPYGVAGFVGVAVAATAFGTTLGWIAGSALLLRTSDRVAALARHIELVAVHLAASPKVREAGDPDLAPIVDAVNALVARLVADRSRLESDASLVRYVVEETPNGVVVVDATGKIRYLNAAVARLVDVREDPYGKRPIEVIAVAEIQQIADQAARGDAIVEQSCSTGRIDLLVRGMRTRRGDVLLLVLDVSKMRAAERARTEFVANVSHELRTPIAALMGYAETLTLEGDLSPTVAKMAETIHRNAKRLRDLFEDLLQLSRIEARRDQLPLDRRVLAPILEAAVAPAADVAARRHQTFEMDCPDDLTASVNAEALGAIVANLANNATNYTPEGGAIRVRVSPEGHEVRIDVEDNGLGIDRSFHERIFERFYRVDEGRSRKVGGTGLGLAIVKHYALATNCRVSVKSEPGVGSTFSVLVPS